MKPSRILVIDDERSSRENLRDLLTEEHFLVEQAEDAFAGLKLMKQYEFDAVLLDIQMPKMNGLTLLERLKKENFQAPIIVFTAFGSSESAIEAMKAGAYDYITKPFDIDELLSIIRRAVNYKSLSGEVQMLREQLVEAERREFRTDYLVSRSPEMQQVYKIIGKVAPTDATVLLEGETGTGKELAANAIWHHSVRNAQPFLKINCAAIPEGLLESELFGHEKGAFTDAFTQRKGLFEAANGGTIFLDEIAEMSTKLQSKLLRILEQGEFNRVGGKETIHVDVRIIAATNRRLEDEVRAGRFRSDLYYRLHVVHIVLPPLRNRTKDILVLANYFLEQYGRKRSLMLSKDAQEALLQYNWPGNVRELENVIQRASVLVQGKIITSELLALPHFPSGGSNAQRLLKKGGTSLRETLRSIECEMIRNALEQTKWNRTKAAALLQIDRRVLFDKIKEYNLQK